MFDEETLSLAKRKKEKVDLEPISYTDLVIEK